MPLEITVSDPPVMTGADAPTLKATTDGQWTNAATWGGRMPADGDIVQIPRGRNVQLNGITAKIGGLYVDGSLTFADIDVELNSRFVINHGLIQAGTLEQPYTKRAVVTLHGTDTSHSVLAMGTKSIAVGKGGNLQLHGENRLAWSQLAANADVGSTSMTLADAATTWRAGDKVVVVSSGFDPREAEVVTLTNVTGNTVSFSPALQFAHLGLVQTIEGQTLDQRAAVGLLSRNIVVRGADDSDAIGFGGHIIVTAGGHAQISGVELTKMGQRGRQGRYPMHWHMAGDRRGDYFAGNAIHDSFQRAAVIHSTSYVHLDGNVAYNIKNHAFVWSEDGDEVGVKMTRNLGVLVSNPAFADFAFPSPNGFIGNSTQAEQRSGVFWGRSYNKHVITGNIAAGVLDGSGFFFDLASPAGKGGDEGEGMVFEDNTAHSSFKALNTGNQINYPEATAGHGLMATTGTNGRHAHTFARFFGYHNVSGAWVEDRSQTLTDSVLADNNVGVMMARSKLTKVTVIGKSANPQPFNAQGHERTGIKVTGSNHGGFKAPLILDATIVNQENKTLWYANSYISHAASLGKIRTLSSSGRVHFDDDVKFDLSPDTPEHGLTDAFGVLLGDGVPARIFMLHSHAVTPDCTPAMNANVCPLASTLKLSSSTIPSGTSHGPMLIEENGSVTAMRSLNYSDPGMVSEGAQSYVNSGRRYTVLSDARSKWEFLLDESADKSVQLDFSVGAQASNVTQNGQQVAKAVSLSALGNATASGWYHNIATQKLHVRIVGGPGLQTVAIEAPFTSTSGYGRVPIALPPGAVDGVSYSAYRNAPTYAHRYAPPTGAAMRSGTSNTANLGGNGASGAILTTSVDGETTVIRGYVYAPVDGTYRMSLYGWGGGLSLWLGETFVVSQPYAFFNSNCHGSGGLEERFPACGDHRMVALQRGWHPIAGVQAKIPEHSAGDALIFRWIPPNSADPSRWTTPDLKRAS